MPTKTRQIDITLPPLHPGQTEVRQSDARFRVLCCGRRWGKSRLCVALAIASALDGGRVWWLAPTYQMGEIGWEDMMLLVNQLPDHLFTINRSDKRINFTTGGAVQIRTADEPDRLRGDSLDLVIFDEASFVSRLEEIWQNVIRPSLADRRGKAIFASTPNGRNFFYQLYQNGLDPLTEDWQSWQFPTGSNPHIPTDEIESAKASMPSAKFSQEFEAQFVDSASVFRNVVEQSTARPQSSPVDGHTYTIGVDWGRVADFTTFCVYDQSSGSVAFLDRFTGIDFEQQISRLAVIVDRYKPSVCAIETNSIGMPLFEQIQRLGLDTRLHGVTMTNSLKAELVDNLALALERKEIELIRDSVLRSELQSYEASRTATGLTRYSHPSGGHDDTVDALLLAYGVADRIAPRPKTGMGHYRRGQERKYKDAPTYTVKGGTVTVGSLQFKEGDPLQKMLGL